MDLDWKKLISSLAPALGTALGGPLVGMAISTIGDAVLGKPDATEEDLSKALKNGSLSGDQIIALRAADKAFDVRMRELDIDVLRVNQTSELAYVADTADARKSFAGNENVFMLAVCILIGFAILMGLVLVGCFLLMTGYFRVDPNVAAICAGLIGTVIGYVASNAQQTVSFFFGSSKGASDQGRAVGAALTESIKQVGATK